MKTANKFLCAFFLATAGSIAIATPIFAQMSAANDVASASRDVDRGDTDTRGDREDDGVHNGPTRLVQADRSGTAGPQIPVDELEMICGGPATYMASWLEDENGDPIPGTFDYECLDDDE